VADKTPETVHICEELLKYFYGGTLHVLPFEIVDAFWSSVYTDYFQKTMSRQEFFISIWNCSIEINFECFLDLLNRLDVLFSNNNFGSRRFMTDILPEITHGIIVSSEKFLNMASPYFEQLFSATDLRQMILTLFGESSIKIVPSMVHRMIDHNIRNDYSIATMLYLYSSVSNYPKFYKRFPDYNFNIWTAAYLQELPVCFKLPRFENLKVLSDCKSMETILSGENVCYRDGKVFCNGQLIGIETSFFQYLSQFKKRFEEYDVKDCKVYYSVIDYPARDNNELLLSEGCCYSTPVYIYQLIYKRSVKRPKEMFSEIINSLREDTSGVWLGIKEKHEKILHKKRDYLEVIYDRTLSSVSVNGKTFVSNVPARIFSRIIKRYVQNNQNLFEHREFAKDPEIIDDRVNPNFVVRLRRLIEAVERDYPEIRIQKVSRGKFKVFIENCVVNYREI